MIEWSYDPVPGLPAGDLHPRNTAQTGQAMAAQLDPQIREDLKRVFLAIHGSAIVTTIPALAEMFEDRKPQSARRYAAELVGVLDRLKDKDGNPLVFINEKAGKGNNDEAHDWWQTFFIVDDKSVDEMDDLFDASIPMGDSEKLSDAVIETAVASATLAEKPKRDTNPADLPMCLCGCGFVVSNRKRNYKPGHDARHAGDVARAIAGADATDEAMSLLDVLPTNALQIKARDMAIRLIGKASNTKAQVAKREPKQEKVVFIEGTVKIGRWDKKAQQNSVSGTVNWFDKKTDKWNVADDKTAATFKPGA